MEPRLAVLGLNHRTSPVALRERFSERFRRSLHFASDLMISAGRKKWNSWGRVRTAYRGTGRCPDDPRVAHHRAHCQLLAREPRELPDRSGQGMLTAPVQKLFQLDKPDLIETGQEN